MQIGIIGLGCIGTANRLGLEYLGHSVISHDPELNTTIDIVQHTEIAFVCVPTPSNQDGSCDTSIIESVLDELSSIKYQGIIAIRSTVYPGFTQSMIELHPNLTICFVPEFLRERCAYDDFVNNQMLLAIGTNSDEIYQKIVLAYKDLPKNTVQLTTQEAEILKYFNNTYAAMRVTFANVMYEICQTYQADYTLIKNSYIKTGKSTDMYLDVAPNLRGFGGMCLPKDVLVLKNLLQIHNLPFKLFDAIHHDNNIIGPTVFDGMRK